MSVMHPEMEKSDEMRMEWDPFSDDQIEGLFFGDAGRAELVEQLLHLLRYGSPLTLLVGPAGIGKRNLLNHLLTQMDPDLFDIAVVEAGTVSDFAQLLTMLDDPWRSLRPFSPDNFLELVPAVAAAADEESKTLVCIVRGAQQMSTELLVGLQSLLSASAGLPVKCLLLVDAGELESAGSLHSMVDALPETAVLYLDPLNQAQTEAYLKYRMHTAGLGQVSFNEEQVARIFAESAGNIARINTVASEVLLEALPAPKAVAPKQSLPWMHIGALGAVVLALMALVLTRPDSVSEQASAPSNTVVLENPIQQEPTKPTPFTEVARVAAEISAAEAEQSPAVDDGKQAPVEPVSVSDTPSTAVSAPAVVEAPAVSRPEEKSVAVSAPVPEVAAPPVVARPTPVATQPAVVAVEAKKPAPDSRTSWLLGLPKEHYVLQLLGAQEEATVKRFLTQYPSLQKVTYYKTWRQAKPWYVVVQGDYVDYDAAKAGIDRLPSTLQKQSPWIRKVEVIHQQLGH